MPTKWPLARPLVNFAAGWIGCVSSHPDAARDVAVSLWCNHMRPFNLPQPQIMIHMVDTFKSSTELLSLWWQQETPDWEMYPHTLILLLPTHQTDLPHCFVITESYLLLMMTYSISKSFTFGALFFVLSSSSEAFSHSYSLRVSATHRLKSDLLYRKNGLIDLENVNPALLSTTSAQVKTKTTAAPKKDKHLVKIDFKRDLSKQLDVAMPYYSLENENAIVDGTTGDCRGIICTVKNEAPIGREAGEISFFEFLRAAGLISSAAVILAKPFKKRHHTPAESYSVDVNPAHENWLREEISSIVGGESFFDNASDPVFLTMWVHRVHFRCLFCRTFTNILDCLSSYIHNQLRCNSVSKRTATIAGALKTNDTVWYITASVFVISAPLFKRKFPPPSAPTSSLHTSTNPYKELSSKLQHIKTYSSPDKDWVCLEGTLPPVTSDDCSGHFYDNSCLPHSVMIFHSCDLLGMAIENLTGVSIPFKKRDSGQDFSLGLVSFDCTPEKLHFANTFGLKLQAKVYCSSGEMGKPDSTYVVEFSAVQDVTNLVCFKATGRFVLVLPSSPGRGLISCRNATAPVAFM